MINDINSTNYTCSEYWLNIPDEMPLSRRKTSREPPMPMLPGGLGIMKLLLGGCGMSIKGQMCSFLHGTHWQVGSWQGSEAIILFINPCLLTPTLTAGVTPTVALAWWVVPFLSQSKVTHINSTKVHWKTQLCKYWSWWQYKMTMMTKNVVQMCLWRKTVFIKSKSIPEYQCEMSSLFKWRTGLPVAFKGIKFLNIPSQKH